MMKDEFLPHLQGNAHRGVSPNPTIQTLNVHPKFSLPYLGEMSEGQRG